ncbi:hypothetical protein EN738_27490, partial [Mesorhizobium sp. M4B.F.Ca.ET.017.02.2.1]
MAPFPLPPERERWRCEAAAERGNHLATVANRCAGNSLHRAEGRPPLRRAALDTSPPIDGGEEGRQ